MTIQSAIYLTGNKRKLLSSIIPHLKGYKVLIDLFTGSGTVAINAAKECCFEKIIANDNLEPLIGIHNALKSRSFIDTVAFTNSCYPETKEGYLLMREDYNSLKRLDLLLNLQYRSNSNMMRWNKSGDFNMTYGERARFDEGRLLQHHHLCQDIEFYNEDYVKFVHKIKDTVDLKDCVFYIDPPYQNTTATYNEQGNWQDTQDSVLLDIVEFLQLSGAKVVMSNVFSNRGKYNTWLIKWCDENKDNFDVHHLCSDYSNSSFRKSNHKTDEVLIVSKEK